MLERGGTLIALAVLLGFGAGCRGATESEVGTAPVEARAAAPQVEAAAPPEGAKAERALATLPEAAWEEGCSCTWSFVGGEGVALSGDVSGSPLRASIGGQVVELRCDAVARTVGGVSVYRAAGGPYTVTMTMTRRVECSPGDEDCEGTVEEQQVHVDGAGLDERFDVSGGCGC